MTRVLLTNDDGVEAAGLAAVVSAMRDAGHDVVVVAPDGNRSAMGHKVTVREQLVVTRLVQEPGLEVWSCSGTPADCVRVAYFADWIAPFDLVCSGLNHGVNLGEDVFYSGTFAAAVEAAFLGVPAIAASQAGANADPGFLSEQPRAFPHAHYLAAIADTVAAHLSHGYVLNFNFPMTLANDEVRACELGGRNWAGAGIEAIHDAERITVTHPWAVDPAPVDDPSTDFGMLPRSYATVTPLQVRGGMRSDVDQWARLLQLGLPARIMEAPK